MLIQRKISLVLYSKMQQSASEMILRIKWTASEQMWAEGERAELPNDN